MSLSIDLLERPIINTSQELSLDGPSRMVVEYYSNLYGSESSDSPSHSRVSLARRARPIINTLGSEDIVLNVGSGPQIWEREYLTAYKKVDGAPICKIVTVDIADIDRSKLKARDNKDITHIRANGQRLPFVDNSMSLVISNMALDFMGGDATDEVYRTLKPGGHVLVNLHHASLIPEDLDTRLARARINSVNLTPKRKQVYEFWKHLRDNKVLTADPEVIDKRFENHGFEIKRVEEVSDGTFDKWWEVELFKPARYYHVPEGYKNLLGSAELVLAENKPTQVEKSEPFMFRDTDTMNKEDQGKQLQIERELAEIMSKPRT